MDNVQNCDSYINIPSSQTYRSWGTNERCPSRARISDLLFVPVSTSLRQRIFPTVLLLKHSQSLLQIQAVVHSRTQAPVRMPGAGEVQVPVPTIGKSREAAGMRNMWGRKDGRKESGHALTSWRRHGDASLRCRLFLWPPLGALFVCPARLFSSSFTSCLCSPLSLCLLLFIFLSLSLSWHCSALGETW
jgi:hypothetical protein